MGHESMCMHKEYQPYDCSSEGGGRERMQSAEKQQEQKRQCPFLYF